MKRKTFLLLSGTVILLISLILTNSSGIGKLLLYFDSQSISTLDNFLVSRKEIAIHKRNNQKFIDIDKISLDLSIDMKTEHISGKENITFSLKKNIEPVFNLSSNMKVNSVKLNLKKVNFSHNDNFLLLDTLFSSNEKQHLVISYDGKPEEGLFFYSKDSIKYLFSINEPISASGWFACNDTPADKFLFSLQATVDSGYQVISNGKKFTESLFNNKRITVWKTIYPIASYLAALYIGEYSETSQNIKMGNDSLYISVFSYPTDKEPAEDALLIVDDAITQLQKYFGEYPFTKDKYAIVEIPWNYGGIENQTAIGIGENYFRSPEMFTELFVHETAHEWWGNCVGIENWDDIWIDEGMANYSQALYWKEVAGKDAFKTTMLAMLDNALRKGKIRNRESKLFANIVYDKSAWIFRMLNYELGDSLFYKSLRKYISLYKYKTGNAYKLKTVFENTSDKNLNKFFDQWIWGESGFIKLNCNYDIDKNLSKVTLSIRQKSEKEYSFILPINFYYKRNLIKAKNVKIVSADTIITVNDIMCDSVAFDPDYTLLREKIEVGK